MKRITYYFVFILLQFNMRNGRVVPVSGGAVMEGRINGNLTRTYSLPFLPDLKLRSTENRSHGTTRNKVIRLGWSRIGLAVLILHAVGVGLTSGPAFISGRYNRFNSLQLQNHCATHTFRHFNTHIHAQLCGTSHGKWSSVSRHYAGRSRRNPVWSGREAH